MTYWNGIIGHVIDSQKHSALSVAWWTKAFYVCTCKDFTFFPFQRVLKAANLGESWTA